MGRRRFMEVRGRRLKKCALEWGRKYRRGQIGAPMTGERSGPQSISHNKKGKRSVI